MKSLIYMPSILKLIFNKLIQFKRFFFFLLVEFYDWRYSKFTNVPYIVLVSLVTFFTTFSYGFEENLSMFDI